MVSDNELLQVRTNTGLLLSEKKKVLKCSWTHILWRTSRGAQIKGKIWARQKNGTANRDDKLCSCCPVGTLTTLRMCLWNHPERLTHHLQCYHVNLEPEGSGDTTIQQMEYTKTIQGVFHDKWQQNKGSKGITLQLC